MYERLLPDDPTRRDVWEPYARACREIGDVGALDRIVQATLSVLVDPQERNALRLELARLLVARSERPEEAKDILRGNGIPGSPVGRPAAYGEIGLRAFASLRIRAFAPSRPRGFVPSRHRGKDFFFPAPSGITK